MIEDKEIEDFKNAWAKYDKSGSGLISIHDLSKFLFDLKEPMGWD
jgi:Ca2+-binding EF-hand superfamily protein